MAATKEHIQAGDIFQLVLSQRFERRTFATPFEIYRALRVVNPSPYMVYMQVGRAGWKWNGRGRRTGLWLFRALPDSSRSILQADGTCRASSLDVLVLHKCDCSPPDPPTRRYCLLAQARGCHIVSSSPEILCRVDNSRVVTNRPLAGTRPRGKDTEADKALEVRVCLACRCRCRPA